MISSIPALLSAGARMCQLSSMPVQRRNMVVIVFALVAIVGTVFLLFPRKTRRPSLPENLRLATRVLIYAGPPEAEGVRSLLEILAKSSRPETHPGKHPDMLALLKTAKKSPFTRARAKADYTFVVFNGVGPEHKLNYYGYNSASGELGSGREWCVVPSKFKAWMLTLIENRKPEEPIPSIRLPGGIGISPGPQPPTPPQPKKQVRKPQREHP